MKRTLTLLLWGLTPFATGYALDLLLYIPIHVPQLLISLILLLLWGFLNFKDYRPNENVLKNTMLIHIPAFVVLLLLLYQELYMGHYWLNLIGSLTQMFYLSFVTLGAIIIAPFMNIIVIWPVYILEFIIVFIVGLIGGALGKRQKGIS